MNQDEIRMKTVINKKIAYQDEMGMGFKRRIGFYKMLFWIIGLKY